MITLTETNVVQTLILNLKNKENSNYCINKLN